MRRPLAAAHPPDEGQERQEDRDLDEQVDDEHPLAARDGGQVPQRVGQDGRARNPTTGATTRGNQERLVAATPMPTPMRTVNIGCANGDIRHRATKVPVSASPPPSAQACARYWMFSVNAKPVAQTPA